MGPKVRAAIESSYMEQSMGRGSGTWRRPREEAPEPGNRSPGSSLPDPATDAEGLSQHHNAHPRAWPSPEALLHEHQ